nr:hypothetical protein [Tanacetum cinerariifolium]
MSSASSAVTYTSVYTDSELGRPVAPSSPNYLPGPEHPPSLDFVPGPEHPSLPVYVPYVPELEYPEYLVPFDAEAPLEDQPLPADALPIALSPGYVADSDPDEDLEEDPEEDHADYPADGGKDKDEDDDDDDICDDDEEPFEDEEDDEEEEHLALANSPVVLIIDLVPSAEDTEAFGTDEAALTLIPSITILMSDASSAVTYTFVYTDSESWRYYGEDSAKTGPPRVIIYGYDGLPIQLVALPSLDYVLSPEHPPSPDYVPSPEHPPSPVEIPYVPAPKYPEYLAPSNDEAPLEDQPLPVDASPIAASPGYVTDFDLEEDPEDDQADYPTDGGDADDEPSDDDDDDDTEDEDPEEEPFKDEEDGEEEEEHLASADSSAVPIIDHTRLCRVQKTVRPEPPMSASMEACIARHAALPSPPLLVPSLPLHFPSPLTTSLTDTGAPLGYRAAEIRMRTLLPSTSRRTDTLDADMPPRKRACLTTPTPRFKIRESFAAGATRQPGPTESNLKRYRVEQACYRITDTWDKIVDTLMKIALTTLEGVNERVTELDTIIRQITDEFKIHLKEAHDNRALLRTRVNTLLRDIPDHRRTAKLMDREAMHGREAWAFSMDGSSAITGH